MRTAFFQSTVKGVVATPFEFGNALQFDGVNDYVELSSDVIGVQTFNCWFYTTAVRSWMPLAGFNSTSNRDYITWRNNGILYIGVNSSYDTSINIGTTPINQWVMLTVTYTYSPGSFNLDVYINGLLVDSGTVGATDGDVVSFNRIGNETGLISTAYFNGMLDEVAMWNTALNAIQIANLYNSGAGDYASNYSPANLIAYYRMNGSGTDTTAIDEQGNYNGTLINFPTLGMWVAH